MRYKLLGASGLRVSELALGTMTFGETWGWGASKDESRKIFEAFAEAGGNFVDTANNYTDGTSEEYVGDLVASDREHFVIATKYTLSTRRDDPNAGGNHRKNMVQALEASLRRLRTDYVDLLWLHMWDGLTPVEEILRTFDDLVRAGKVLYVGFSDTPAWVVSRAHAIASVRGWTPPSAVQLPLSLADRGAQRDHLPMARDLDLAVCAWGTLEGGTLTGKYFAKDGGPRRYSAEPSETEQALAREVMAVADETGSSPAQVAINWVRQQPGLVIPIIGARTEEQAGDNLASLEHSLSDKQLDRLTDTAPISLGFPHSFLASQHVTELIFGDTRPLIDSHRAA
jgi:aryl-alcohol dehydrogenase-like predicted oxidoreductase